MQACSVLHLGDSKPGARIEYQCLLNVHRITISKLSDINARKIIDFEISKNQQVFNVVLKKINH